MSEYAAGTVAVATVRGVPNVRVFRTGDGAHKGWRTTTCWYDDGFVTDVRPLVVLDLDALEGGRFIPRWLRERADAVARTLGHDPLANRAIRALADQIEAQRKPPKPEEPRRLGAVVEDVKGKRWIRTGDSGMDDWREAGIRSGATGQWHTYDRIDAVKVLSEGVS